MVHKSTVLALYDRLKEKTYIGNTSTMFAIFTSTILAL